MPPVLMLLKGLPGSGKSTLADCLSTQLLWPVLDKDDSRDCLSQVRHLSRDELNSLSYDILLQCTQRQIANGISVIVDCPLAKLDLAEKFAALSTAHGAKLAIIGCEMADEKVWEARITARGQASAGTSQSHKPESWAALQALIHGYEGAHLWARPDDDVLQYSYLAVDMTSLDTKAAAATVLAWLRHNSLGLSSDPISSRASSAQMQY